MKTVVVMIVTGLMGWAVVARAANGTAYYLDINDTTPGFGDPSGTYTDSQNVWSTNADGTGTSGVFPQYSQLTIGNPGIAGISNAVFSLSPSWKEYRGLAINVPCTVTWSGGAGYLDAAQTWSVTSGATLHFNTTVWNMNNQSVTFQGGGTINFNGSIGYNCNNANNPIVQDMAGGTVNVRTSYVNGTVPQAGFTLQNGTLNFATPSSAGAFSNQVAARGFTINGGTIDNTSGAPMALDIGGGVYGIGGSFTFAGTGNLNLGTNAVNLGTGTPAITVGGGCLAFGGSITNTAGLVKAGAGTLALGGDNSYGGATIVSNGVLWVNNVSGSGTGTNGVFVLTNATLGGVGSIAGAVTVAGGGQLAPGTNGVGTLSVGGLSLGANARFAVELGGTNALASDRLVVSTGNISLNGGTLALSLINGYQPRDGDTIVIIRNVPGNPVSGVFAGGSSASIPGLPGAFHVGYAAGSGHDVVLQYRPAGTVMMIR